MKVTRKQMLEILPDTGRVDRYLHYINAWADIFEINTPLRMAHFLAQVLHETAGFKFMKEQGKVSYFSKYDKGSLAKMLGNTKKGDGWKYRGRGFLMLTGRHNYQSYQNSEYCKGDIMEKPELLEGQNGSVKSGMWWWFTHGLNELADKDDIVKITKKINGGLNGIDDRKNWFQICKKVLL